MKVRSHNDEQNDSPICRAASHDALNVGLGDIGKFKVFSFYNNLWCQNLTETDLKKYFCIFFITIVSTLESILIFWANKTKKVGLRENANVLGEAIKCGVALLALSKYWRNGSTTENNTLRMPFVGSIDYSFPAALCFIHSLLHSSLYAYMDGRNNISHKILNIIATGVLSHIILKKKLSISFTEVINYYVPAALCFVHYLIKTNLFALSDGRNNTPSKLLDIINTGVLSHLILRKKKIRQ